MLRKALLLIAALVLVFCVFGCKKSSDQGPAEPAEEQVQSAVEYQAEAEEEITEENMADELDQLEEEIDQEEVGGL